MQTANISFQCPSVTRIIIFTRISHKTEPISFQVKGACTGVKRWKKCKLNLIFFNELPKPPRPPPPPPGVHKVGIGDI